jgi:uncharacterized protein
MAIYKKGLTVKFDCLEVEKIDGFEWDEGNKDKNLRKHGLPHSIIEEIFFNDPLLVVEDFKHSEGECRCLGLGKTFDERYLFVAFTVRNNKIRVISARAMNKNERSIYENQSL